MRLSADPNDDDDDDDDNDDEEVVFFMLVCSIAAVNFRQLNIIFHLLPNESDS